MVLYRYECTACSKFIDKDFKMGDAPSATKCECGFNAKRVYVAPTVKILNPSEARIGRGAGR